MLQDEERSRQFNKVSAEYFVDGHSRLADSRLEYNKLLEQISEREAYRILYSVESTAGIHRDLDDSDNASDDDDGDESSQSCQLPSSYLGSRRWAAEQVAGYDGSREG